MSEISTKVIEIGGLAIDLDKEIVCVNGSLLYFSRKEYRILKFLCLNKDVVVTKEMLLDHLYGGSREPNMKVLDVFVCKIRLKLSTASDGKNYIETVWGRGYVLLDPEAPEVTLLQDMDTARRSRAVKGPDGYLMTIDNLPPTGTKRWVMRRKAQVVAAVCGELLSLEEVKACYKLSKAEYLSWQNAVDKHGLQGLRTTYIQEYRH